ncbi:MAG: lysylphosphatidylglycerol synthase transmembrane domain-containing protein [Acidimicrobiia bacterium]
MPVGSPSSARVRWMLALRIAVSAALLTYLATKIHFEQAFPKRPHVSNFLWFGCGVVAVLGGIWLSAWRWQRVLSVFDVHVRVRRLLGISLAGLFVGNVLPSTIGGDVLRVSRCTRDGAAREHALASVIIERLTGFVVLPLFVILGFVMWPAMFTKGSTWVALLVAGIALTLLFAILVLAASPRVAGRFLHHRDWTRFIGAVHVGIDRMRREPGETAMVLLAALVFQCTTIATVFFAVHTVGAAVPIAAVVAAAAAVAMVQVLPISLSGLGVREGMFALLLHGLGVPTGKSVAIGLCWYAMTLVASFAGGPTFAFGHRARREEPINA